ncbi:thiol-disulfide oxidoreductase DCC family protein [Hyphococcus sp.]|uniref:thiol-disulfide oxidoreductase DCC family protein n=1 Tax=Hyphococcus sp. TaxID=2038636 RepID=UPI0020898CAF|nr:MAG: thiol-disulfide oxidoreductase [Marinicaulis sp.]
MRRLVNLYSYRTDPNVPSFNDSHPLLIFDGECVLCSSGVQWMIERDPQGDTKFAAIQEPVPRGLYVHYGLDPKEFDSFMVLADGQPYLRWRGVCAAGRLLPAPWKWLGAAGRLIPDFIGDAIYDFIQRNRIGWFGKRDACMMPDDLMRSRFLTPAQ